MCRYLFVISMETSNIKIKSYNARGLLSDSGRGPWGFDVGRCVLYAYVTMLPVE